MIGTLAFLLTVPHAAAATVTELAPWLRGDIAFSYDVDITKDTLHEGGTAVARRSTVAHTVTYAGSFTAAPGVALFFELPQYAGTQIQFTDAHEMVYDPLLETGTMLDTPGIETPPDVEGKGVGGAWLGLRGAPMHEEFFAKRGDRVSWLIEVGLRFKDKSNLYTIDDAGQRGAGPGSGAWRIQSAFSTTHRNAQPYLVGTFTRSGRLFAQLTDSEGAVLVEEAQLQPATTVDARAGVEIQAHQWTGKEDWQLGRLVVDLRTRAGYRTWQDVPSGLYLPSVLGVSRSVPVTQSESAHLFGGVGLQWQIIEYLRWSTGGDVGFHSPHRIEHPYNVSTGMNNIGWQVHTELRFQARDPLFDQR